MSKLLSIKLLCNSFKIIFGWLIFRWIYNIMRLIKLMIRSKGYKICINCFDDLLFYTFNDIRRWNSSYFLMLVLINLFCMMMSFFYLMLIEWWMSIYIMMRSCDCMMTHSFWTIDFRTLVRIILLENFMQILFEIFFENNITHILRIIRICGYLSC